MGLGVSGMKDLGFRVFKGLGFRVQGFGVKGLGFRAYKGSERFSRCNSP